MCVEPVKTKNLMLVRGFLRCVVTKVHHASCIVVIVRKSFDSSTTCLNADVENRYSRTRNGESEKSLAGLQRYETLDWRRFGIKLSLPVFAHILAKCSDLCSVSRTLKIVGSESQSR